MKYLRYQVQVGLVAVAMLAGMTLFEAAKQAANPDISVWESHAITILASTVFATVSAYFLLRRQFVLNQNLGLEVAERVKAQAQLEQSIRELQETLSTVKTLSGLLPICASCKKIRDDKGYWNHLESYLREHSDAVFSHGVCPSCAKKLYPDFLDGVE